MEPRRGTVSSDGVTLSYLDWGGVGPPLLLIHATGFLGALWRPIADRLADRFRVVAVDQRGHGESGRPEDGYRFETFADDLQALVDDLDLHGAVACGHSSGGTTIVYHTAAHPGVIRRAILIEPILPRREWHANPPPGGRNAFSLAEGARKRRSEWPSRDEALSSYRGRDMFRLWSDDILRIYVDEGLRERDDGQVELKCPPEIEACFFEVVQGIDPWPLLPRLACPTLVLWGADSHLAMRGPAEAGPEQAYARLVEKALPNARTVVVPEATHFLPQERPDEVARAIEEFLAD
jgi:pimeloyl-ACP methyl ester carboxylesterase